MSFQQNRVKGKRKKVKTKYKNLYNEIMISTVKWDIHSHNKLFSLITRTFVSWVIFAGYLMYSLNYAVSINFLKKVWPILYKTEALFLINMLW